MGIMQDILDAADGATDIYGKVKSIDAGPVEATAPTPDPDRQPVATSTGFQGFGQYGLQSSVGVVGVIALIYLLVTR